MNIKMENKKYWWLNEESHDMLKRGYLVENQTVEEKLNIITSHASNILKRHDLKEKVLEII